MDSFSRFSRSRCQLQSGSMNAKSYHTMDLWIWLSPDGSLPTRYLHQVWWCSCRLSKTFRDIHGPSCFRSCCHFCVLQSNPRITGEREIPRIKDLRNSALRRHWKFHVEFHSSLTALNRSELSECSLLCQLKDSSTLTHRRHRWSLVQCCITCNASTATLLASD